MGKSRKNRDKNNSDEESIALGKNSPRSTDSDEPNDEDKEFIDDTPVPLTRKDLNTLDRLVLRQGQNSRNITHCTIL